MKRIALILTVIVLLSACNNRSNKKRIFEEQDKQNFYEEILNKYALYIIHDFDDQFQYGAHRFISQKFIVRVIKYETIPPGSNIQIEVDGKLKPYYKNKQERMMNFILGFSFVEALDIKSPKTDFELLGFRASILFKKMGIDIIKTSKDIDDMYLIINSIIKYNTAVCLLKKHDIKKYNINSLTSQVRKILISNRAPHEDFLHGHYSIFTRIPGMQEKIINGNKVLTKYKSKEIKIRATEYTDKQVVETFDDSIPKNVFTFKNFKLVKAEHYESNRLNKENHYNLDRKLIKQVLYRDSIKYVKYYDPISEWIEKMEVYDLFDNLKSSVLYDECHEGIKQ
ncbi:MAG: hypothetical protein HOA61_14425 [Bacteroidetes bacterium]|jgi:hypothetical protein|nr:hypothetical protein [Bacteroidota bacterium]